MKTSDQVQQEFLKELDELLIKWDAGIELNNVSMDFTPDYKIYIEICSIWENGEYVRKGSFFELENPTPYDGHH